MFEHRSDELLPRRRFIWRLLRNVGIAAGVVGGSLGIGILGYHGFEGLSWLDATLNASMILGGMGPVDPVRTANGKLFASAYALFSGIAFLSVAAILFAPLLHRLLHRFHVDPDDDETSAPAEPARKNKR